MSFTVTTDVFCNNCGNWIQGVASHKPERTKAWAIAQRAGWKKKARKHFCPDCSAKKPEIKPAT